MWCHGIGSWLRSSELGSRCKAMAQQLLPTPLSRAGGSRRGVRPWLEALEDRTTPSISVALSGAGPDFVVVFTDDNSATVANVLEFQVTPTNELAYSINGSLFSTDLDSATGGIQNAVITDIDNIVVNLGSGNDTLRVNSTLATTFVAPNLSIEYDGGGQAGDSLELIGAGGGATFDTTYTAGPDTGGGSVVTTDGSVTQTIFFTGVSTVQDSFACNSITVNGTDAANAITYTAAQFLSGGGRVAIDNFWPVEFRNKANLFINGLGGTDTIDLSNATRPTGLTGIITVDGGNAADDSIVLQGTAAAETFEYRPTGATSGTLLYSLGVPPVTPLPNVAFSNIEAVQIDGRSDTNADALLFTTLAGADNVVLTPGDAFDSGVLQQKRTSAPITTPALTFSRLGTGATVTVQDAAAVRSDILKYQGTNLSDTFTVTAANGGTAVLNNQIEVRIPGVTSLQLAGLEGNDTFNITPLAATVIGLDGGVPLGDKLALDAESQPLFTATGRYTAFGRQSVSVTGIEGVQLNNAASVSTFYGPDTADRATALASLSPAQRFVQVLYLNALGRAGSLAELDSWVAVLQTNGRLVVASGIERSPEARLHLVQTWYLTYLGRPLGINEPQGWVNMLLAGVSEEVTLSGILGSAEFFARAQTLIAAGTPDERFVRALYLLLLDRTASAAEVAGHVANIASRGRNGVAQDFLFSAELRTNLIEVYYNTLLHRAVDGDGLNSWFSSGFDATNLRTGIESSNEFFQQG